LRIVGHSGAERSERVRQQPDSCIREAPERQSLKRFREPPDDAVVGGLVRSDQQTGEQIGGRAA